MQIDVIGPGRAGTAIARHAAAAGIACRLGRCPSGQADVVLIATPDRAVRQVAEAVPAGPAVGTLSGSVPLDHLLPHARRFALHPMQTIQPGDGLPLAGCAAGITADDEATAALARELAERLGMRPVDIPAAARPLPHVACVLASNLLAAPLAAAVQVLAAADPAIDPRATLGPLAHRAIDDALAAGPGAQPTGPLARGDVDTVRRHLEALEALDPRLAEAYRELSLATLPLLPETIAATVRPTLEAAA
jgi:predicted short-subunit dehydrogenase-like oxidoreductase (DUF2520 family)